MSRILSLLPLALTLALAGCAVRQPVLTAVDTGPASPERLELTDTPFNPQQRYQCGPAALATVLQYSGVDVSADQLVPQIYLPARKGSLQVEMLAASRRYNRVPYVIDPDIGALVRALQAGYPVVILQNLGLAAFPVWHYAVVTGYSREDDRIILRSGTDERKTEPARIFLATWDASANWGLILLRPGDIPAGTDRSRYVAAIAAMEDVADPSAVLDAYRSALRRWPRDLNALFGLASTLQQDGKLLEAQRAYRELLLIQPGHIAALNNLADLYATRGCHGLAAETIATALAVNKGHEPFHTLLSETRRNIQAKSPGEDPDVCSEAPARAH